VRFADHLAALTDRRFQSLDFAHGSLLAHRPGLPQSRPVTDRAQRGDITERDLSICAAIYGN
jgi:hypothetical protein